MAREHACSLWSFEFRVKILVYKKFYLAHKVFAP